jgi:hypothetical protein
MCGDSSRAGHYFATYFDNSHVIKLHFEHPHCVQQNAYCALLMIAERLEHDSVIEAGVS